MRDSAPDPTFESPCQSAARRLDPTEQSRSSSRPAHSACPTDSRASACRDNPPEYDPAATRSRGPSARLKAPCGNPRRPSPCGLLLGSWRLYLWQSLSSAKLPPSLARYAAPTVDPTGSPSTTRFRFPGTFMLNTTIGILLSMHSEIAVESITDKPFFSTSR